MFDDHRSQCPSCRHTQHVGMDRYGQAVTCGGCGQQYASPGSWPVVLSELRAIRNAVIFNVRLLIAVICLAMLLGMIFAGN